MSSTTTTQRIRTLMFRTEAALEGDYMGEAKTPALQDRLEAASRFIAATQASDFNHAGHAKVWA